MRSKLGNSGEENGKGADWLGKHWDQLRANEADGLQAWRESLDTGEIEKLTKGRQEIYLG